MFNPHNTGRIVALFAATTLGSLTTGCSSTAIASSFSGMRSIAATSRQTVHIERLSHITVQRHAREHAISTSPAIRTQHHQPTHTL